MHYDYVLTIFMIPYSSQKISELKHQILFFVLGYGFQPLKLIEKLKLKISKHYFLSFIVEECLSLGYKYFRWVERQNHFLILENLLNLLN